MEDWNEDLHVILRSDFHQKPQPSDHLMINQGY